MQTSFPGRLEWRAAANGRLEASHRRPVGARLRRRGPGRHAIRPMVNAGERGRRGPAAGLVGARGRAPCVGGRGRMPFTTLAITPSTRREDMLASFSTEEARGILRPAELRKDAPRAGRRHASYGEGAGRERRQVCWSAQALGQVFMEAPLSDEVRSAGTRRGRCGRVSPGGTVQAAMIDIHCRGRGRAEVRVPAGRFVGDGARRSLVVGRAHDACADRRRGLILPGGTAYAGAGDAGDVRRLPVDHADGRRAEPLRASSPACPGTASPPPRGAGDPCRHLCERASGTATGRHRRQTGPGGRGGAVRAPEGPRKCAVTRARGLGQADGGLDAWILCGRA